MRESKKELADPHFPDMTRFKEHEIQQYKDVRSHTSKLDKLKEHIKENRMWDSSAVKEQGDSLYYYQLDADVFDPAWEEIQLLLLDNKTNDHNWDNAFKERDELRVKIKKLQEELNSVDSLRVEWKQAHFESEKKVRRMQKLIDKSKVSSRGDKEAIKHLGFELEKAEKKLKFFEDAASQFTSK